MVATEVVEDQKVRIAFLPVGDSEVELIESTAPDGPVAKFIEARGEGLQHIAFRVDNVEEALKELKDKSIRLIDEKPRKGVARRRSRSVHPKAAPNGGLVGFMEEEYISFPFPDASSQSWSISSRLLWGGISSLIP